MDFLVVKGHSVAARRVFAAAMVLCSGHASALAAQSTSPEGVAQATDSIWYVTNRASASGGWQNQRGTALSYGVRTFQVAPKPGKQLPWSAAVRKLVLADSVISQSDWSSRLTQSSLHDAAADLPVLVYVHGYGTSFREATEQAAELRRRGDFKGPVVVFSWPARGSGFARPTLDHPFTQAYWLDAERGRASIPDLVVVLQELSRTLGASRLVVAAHSMGNMVIDGALRDSVLSDSLAVTPLRAVAFLAPDVDATYFADSLVTVAKRASSRQVLYGSRNDRMLQISSILHGAPRAGQLSQKGPWNAGLEVLDVTDARVSGNWWIRHFGTNHAFRRRPDAVSDLFGFVLRDVPADCRGTSDAWVRESDGSWRLQRSLSGSSQASMSTASMSTASPSLAPSLADADSVSRAPVASPSAICPASAESRPAGV